MIRRYKKIWYRISRRAIYYPYYVLTIFFKPCRKYWAVDTVSVGKTIAKIYIEEAVNE